MASNPPRILCISFSDLSGDSRVLRQLAVLRRHGHVTTLAYGPPPEGSDEHLEIPRHLPSLPQTPVGVLKLALRRFRSVEIDAPAIRAALDALAGREFDVVVANEARALPLAYRIGGQPSVWCDLHEWAPEERTHVLSWRILVKPFMTWVCAEYLPRVDAATTINDSIAQLYAERFGIHAQVVRNAIAHREDLRPQAVRSDRIRLVHSGGAVEGRNIEAIVDAVDRLDDRFTLDLFLIPGRQSDSYWQRLSGRIACSNRTTLHPPVAPDELPDTLNAFDLGVFALPPHTPNHRLMLPNKLFDFVQARIGLIFGPAVETDRIIQRHQLGLVTAGYAADDLVAALSPLTADDVARFKAASDTASAVLSSEADVTVEESILNRLIRKSR